jgi:Zn-dependent peptidase ImmA (M78 family)
MGLERKWDLFNKEPYTSNALIKLADHLGIITYSDKGIKDGAALNYQGRRVIAYNPHQTESHLTLILGHEIAHHVLGHIMPNGEPKYTNLFDKHYKEEKEAGILGFLFWLPTTELCRMECNGRLQIDELYKYARFYDPELTEDEILKLCESRISIYNALKRIERRYPAARQITIPFEHSQTYLPGM